MSRRAEALVWERSRAGKSDLLMLVKIADLADDDGRNAWPEVPGLMKYCRASERATQYTLQRLERSGEIEIEYNDDGRQIALRGGRTFRPKWFIHVRCVCAWEAYEQEGQKPATSADSVRRRFRPGRPSRKSARLAGSAPAETRNSCTRNPQFLVKKPARSGSAYKEGSVNDPVVEGEPAAPLPLLLDESGADAKTDRPVPDALTAPSTDPLEAFRLAWNDLTTASGLPACIWLTPKRRRLIRACLVERPLAAWRDVFLRTAASDFLAGRTDRRAPATLDWLIADATHALQVLEGQYDNRPAAGQPARTGIDGGTITCPHDPRCATRSACLQLVLADARASRERAS